MFSFFNINTSTINNTTKAGEELDFMEICWVALLHIEKLLYGTKKVAVFFT